MNFRFLFIPLIFSTGLYSQAPEPIVITLSNPSFEDVAAPGHLPKGWFNCGFPSETPPDTQPDTTFQVGTPAKHGKTYLGMVVRENDTYESAGQALSRPMEPGKCYSFSIYLAKSNSYLSPRPNYRTGPKVAYNTPVVLQIWGGTANCAPNELLATSEPVNHTTWIKYQFKLQPKTNCTHLVLRAYYRGPVVKPYNGNLLLDNASAIREMPCDEKKVAEVKPRETKKPNGVGTSAAKVTPRPSRILTDLDRDKIRPGQIIKIQELYFQADATVVDPTSYPVLDEIYDFLRDNPGVIVEVGGHTNAVPEHAYCDKLSLERAKSVAVYIVNKGIPGFRVKYKGYGKRIPVADNKTKEGRVQNQRVEIKILAAGK